MNDELAELKARCARLELLNQVGNIIHSSLDPQEALQLILDQAVKVMRATSGSVVLVNPNSTFLEIHAAMGLPPNAAEVKLRLGEGITGMAVECLRPISVVHAEEHEAFRAFPEPKTARNSPRGAGSPAGE